MRKTFLKAGKSLAAAGFAVALSLFPAPTPVRGADILPSDSSGNTFTVNSAVSGNVYGGRSDNAVASNNNVTVAAPVSGIIFGGYVAGGTGISANNNTVTINSGAVHNIYGAYSEGRGEATGNRVFINGGDVQGTTSGSTGTIISGGYTAVTTNDRVSGNSVTINGGFIDYSGNPGPRTHIYGGRGQNTSNITNNMVTINGGTIFHSEIFGGDITNGGGRATVDGNSVNITGGTIEASVYGGHANTGGSITNNTVTITGGTVKGDIYGGYSAGSGPVTGNEVSIYGGTVTGNIYGGGSLAGNASGNKVTLGGSPTLTGSSLFGSNAFTGNLLQLMEYKSVSKLTSVQNFELYRFCLPPTLDYGYLEAGTVDFTDPSGAVSTVKEVHIMTKGEIAQPANNKITLIKNTGGFSGEVGNKGETISVLQGSTLYFTGDLVQDSNELYLNNVSEPQVNPPSKAIVEGSNTAAVPLQRQGTDLVAGAGLSQAVEATAEVAEAEADTLVDAGISEARAVSEECRKGGNCLKSFSALTGGHFRYNTGSKADLDSLSLLTGLAKGVDLPPGRLTLGGFLEYGVGTYRTNGNYLNIHTNFDDPYLNIQGDGSAWRLGGGLLARQNIDLGNLGSHVYVEGSFRAGETHNRYSHLYPVEFMGNKETVGFEASAPYYGAHSGLGYLWNLSGATSLDIYGKYLWARQAGYSVNLQPFGDPIKFEPVDSRRLLTGLRFSHAWNEKVRPYVGAAYEYEFDSVARATTHGLAIESHSFGGSSEMGEVGLSFKPEPSRPITLDFGLQGYTGMKEGITGSLQLKVEF